MTDRFKTYVSNKQDLLFRLLLLVIRIVKQQSKWHSHYKKLKKM